MNRDNNIAIDSSAQGNLRATSAIIVIRYHFEGAAHTKTFDLRKAEDRESHTRLASWAVNHGVSYTTTPLDA